MVDDGDPEMLFGPLQRRRVGALAGEKQSAKLRQVVAVNELALRILLLDGAEGGGAVKSAATPCSETTRQKAPASGVPTGFPS